MAAAEVTGVGIAIFHNGKVAYLKAYGLRDAEKKLLLTADSIMAGASLTKAAFSYLVMQIVASKAIDLDKPLQQYMPKPIPDYDDYQDLRTDQRYKKLTARMLLSHTGGFPNSRFQNPDHKLNINFEPGSRYAYSGEGIQLLQLAVESISKKPLKELMQERVFGPLDMSRTSMVSEQRFENDYANGYDEWGRSLGHEQRQTAAAAGSMQTTLRDFARFLQAVILPEGLPKHVRELMLTPQIEISSKQQFPTLATATTEENRGIRLRYGLGWGLYWSPYGKAFFKEGHADGVRVDRSERQCALDRNGVEHYPPPSEWTDGLIRALITQVDAGHAISRDPALDRESESHHNVPHAPERTPATWHNSGAQDRLDRYSERPNCRDE